METFNKEEVRSLINGQKALIELNPNFPDDDTDITLDCPEIDLRNEKLVGCIPETALMFFYLSNFYSELSRYVSATFLGDLEDPAGRAAITCRMVSEKAREAEKCGWDAAKKEYPELREVTSYFLRRGNTIAAKN